ncbi:alpha-galactosidase [Streptosporangium becharense]|uniref:Alpha-galactosidase n=1 Tax=Streptosporangium becharense TaxID=1816182 RepID=A0A7W9MEM8_9ACTN|nr:alpha-galactosidase [Streptosporangium becharense]MBB2913033.1 alpha-galactosidase [Streptosporangium becharense]MBB5818142.1 alpha-galactosidase [Streptosporangium becharense]
MSIIPVAEHTWAAVTPASTYLFGVETDGDDLRVVQWYWGPRLPEAALAEAALLVPPRQGSSFLDPRDIDELLPVDGGRRWGVPSLQATYEGGVRSVELAFSEAVPGPDEIELVLRDEAHGLRVGLHVRCAGDTDVIERWVTVANEGTAPVRFGRLDSGSWVIPEQPAYRCTGVFGAWARETQLQRAELPVGETTFTSRTGATSHRANPWIMIDAGDATEESGEVWTVALAWSGSWRLTAQRRPEGDVAVTSGFGHDGPSWHLAPGEHLRTPSALGLYSDGGYGAASRAWHHHARRHVQPAAGEERPVLYNSWEATGFDLSEAGQLELAAKAAALGVELFVVDDGWFGSRDCDSRGLGDWWPDPERFPDGLTRLFDEVRGLGMAAGLWVEPEMVNPDSDLYRSRPDWVLHHPGRRRDTMRNQLVLNFARPDVREWATDWLDGLVRAYDLAYLKWDMNRSFSQAGWPDAGDRADMLWIEHTHGVYTVMDELRRRHPALRIESCSGGGGRVDLGVMRRTDQVWTSDNTDARDRQAIQHGFTYLYPAGVMSAWVTDSPNPHTRRRVPLRYRFHVAMAGVLGIGGNLATWSAEELAEARDLVAAYKAVRPVVQHGRLHRLGGTPGLTASAVQYVLDDRVVVLAYNPFGLDRETPRRLRLAGLDPEARYEVVTSEAGATAPVGSRWHGRTLMSLGLVLSTRLPDGPDYRSELLELRRVETS